MSTLPERDAANVVLPLISESSVNDLIRTWRRARLTCDESELGYPTTSVLHPKHGISEPPPMDTADVDLVQRVVESLPGPVRAVFEAFHLGIIRDQHCRKMPHRWRWLVLGLDQQRYYARERLARREIQESLTYRGFLT